MLNVALSSARCSRAGMLEIERLLACSYALHTSMLYIRVCVTSMLYIRVCSTYEYALHTSMLYIPARIYVEHTRTRAACASMLFIDRLLACWYALASTSIACSYALASLYLYRGRGQLQEYVSVDQVTMHTYIYLYMRIYVSKYIYIV
jgi:hypothetical protein